MAAGATNVGCPVKRTAGRANEAGRVFAVGTVRLATKTIKRSQCAVSGELEDRAGTNAEAAAVYRRPVEGAVGGLNQPRRAAAVGTGRLAAKAIKSGQSSASGRLEEGAPKGDSARSSPSGGGPVEVPVQALDKRRNGILTVGSVET